ncbi:glycosyltransferase [Rhizosaccharibacter radicis]|uniref:Glycosyltransferase n=1 Tax=Rhizosaccharibacter radicis TaxID=2782605 RepID=A0ABT1W157_9PROT|nr:glycosyltransferase [Acetobacteraceae bacterium KSS12]
MPPALPAGGGSPLPAVSSGSGTAFAIGWASLLLAALPLGMALLNLSTLRPPPRAEPGGRRPRLSVLIPARDEENNIGDAVRCVLNSSDVELELLVLDDGSTDRTPDILASIEDDRLRVLRGGPLPRGWSGKQHACSVLGERARHPLLVFVDADVRLEPDALSRLAAFMERHPAVALASGFPHQVTRSWSERLLLPLIHLLLMGYRPAILDRDGLDPAFAAGCGQLFVARRGAYRAVGGHAAIRRSLHDGLTLPRAFRKRGFRTALFDATPMARVRMYEGAAPLWEGLTKNATEGMATPRALPVWTVLLGGGHVLPFLLCVLAPSAPARAALAMNLGLRMLLAGRFRQSLRGAVLHPFGVAGLLGVQWAALWRARRGRPSTWRGRRYSAA